MRKWFDNLSLQYKVSLQIQPILLVLLSAATFFIYQQMKSNIIATQVQRADGIAMQVIDDANMLMVTGAISNTGNRQLMVRKIIEGQHLSSLRLVRTEQVVRQYGTGLPEEHLDDPVVKQTIERSVSAGKSIPHISIEMVNGKPMLRVITPYIESHGFHGTDCLTCHHVTVGSSNGASDLRINLSGKFRHLNFLLTVLIAGQIGLQLLLFFIIAWASTIKSQQRKFEHLAHYDTLTDLPNRRALDEEFDKTMARARRHGRLLAVVMMDLDGFKPVNDIYGHDAGDKVLQIIAQRLRTILRSTDFVARQGGDEFVLLIEDCTNMDEISMALDKVDQAIRLPINLGHGRVIGIAASAGVCLYPFIDTDNSDALLRYADQALYENKAHKNDRARFWTLYGDVTLPRENKMQSLLHHDGLRVFYQPILDNRSQRIVGVEALARLQDSEGAIIAPAEFLPQLTIQELFELSAGVLAQALRDMVILDQETPGLWVSVNIDPRNVSDAYVTYLRERIAEWKIDPQRIYLEILEGSNFDEQQLALIHLQDLKALGVRLALDDVGSAYSSLLRLKDMPIDKIKLDQGFVRTLAQQPQDLQFVQSILDLANGLGKELVVEGVETDDILDMMIVLGVPFMQGYGIARPMPFDELQNFLRRPLGKHRQHPTSLLGIYAKQLANHSTLKKGILQNQHLFDPLQLDDAIACPIHADLIRVRIDQNHPIYWLHSDYHHAIAAQVALSAADPRKNDCSEIEATNQALLLTILTEYHRQMGKS